MHPVALCTTDAPTTTELTLVSPLVWPSNISVTKFNIGLCKYISCKSIIQPTWRIVQFLSYLKLNYITFISLAPELHTKTNLKFVFNTTARRAFISHAIFLVCESFTCQWHGLIHTNENSHSQYVEYCSTQREYNILYITVMCSVRNIEFRSELLLIIRKPCALNRITVCLHNW